MLHSARPDTFRSILSRLTFKTGDCSFEACPSGRTERKMLSVDRCRTFQDHKLESTVRFKSEKEEHSFLGLEEP